jgi:hypothetical protein
VNRRNPPRPKERAREPDLQKPIYLRRLAMDPAQASEMKQAARTEQSFDRATSISPAAQRYFLTVNGSEN